MSLIIVKASIARFVKKLAVLVGLDPAKHARHSLRAGYARAAAIARVAAAQLSQRNSLLTLLNRVD